MKMKLCVAGLTHGHVWGLIENWVALSDIELVAVADSTPLLERARTRFWRTYTDWQEMLKAEAPDIVLACADNRTSAQITIASMQAGAHVMVEKPMSANLADAQTMWQTAQNTQRLLMINWPTRWNPAYQSLFRRAKRGEFGAIVELRFRTGHSGPREIGCDPYFVNWLYDEYLNGGGALIDFGGYGAVMAIDLLGVPNEVLAVCGNFTKDYPISDDHAVILLRYPKAVAVLEATWAQIGTDGAPNPIIYGTEATAGMIDAKLRIHRRGQSSPTIEDPEPLHAGERNPAEYFYNCIRNNRSPEGVLNPEIALQAQAILERAKVTT